MLEMDADNRINADQALSHPYLAQYADPSDEPVSLPYDQTFEDFDLPVEKWKGLYLTMVFCYQNCSDLLWENNCSSDREKLLKFEAEGQEFAKSLEQFIQTVKGQNNFW